MNEAEGMRQEKKPRMSIVAICSVLIPLPLCIGIVILIYAYQSVFAGYLFPLGFVAYLLAPLTFILGIWGIVRVAKSRGLLKGYIPAAMGVIVSVFCWHCSMMAAASVRPHAAIERCEIRLMEIGKALASYSNDYGGKYPAAERWSDLLIEHYRLNEGIFRELPSRDGGYALNPDATPVSAADVVLVFEVKSEWGEWRNQFGGPERLTVEIHCIPTILPRTDIRGCNVLFNDGHVEFVEAEDIDKLKWNDK